MKYVTTFFGCNQSQLKAILFLLFLIALTALIPYLFTWQNAPLAIDTARIDSLFKLNKNLDYYENNDSNQYKFYKKDYKAYTKNNNNYEPSNRYEKFDKQPLRPQTFDPNIASEQLLKDIGLKQYVINNMLKYRSAGGKWQSKEEFKRVYGLDEAVYDELESFITLPDTKAKYTNFDKNNSYSTFTKKEPKKSFIVEVNTADTTAFEALPMIGKKLALRIVTYRKSLGGFIDVAQVKEVFGITDSTWLAISSKLKIEDNLVIKININSATEQQLKAHPYMKSFAKILVAYRTQHGIFTAIDDLKKIRVIDEALFNKVKPYITI